MKLTANSVSNLNLFSSEEHLATLNATTKTHTNDTILISNGESARRVGGCCLL